MKHLCVQKCVQPLIAGFIASVMAGGRVIRKAKVYDEALDHHRLRASSFVDHVITEKCTINSKPWSKTRQMAAPKSKFSVWGSHSFYAAADRTSIMQILGNLTAHPDSAPSALDRSFIIGAINGLILSAIFWIFLAGGLYIVYWMIVDAR
jgi:hypothetical protein